MKICVIERGLCVNVAHIVSCYVMDERIIAESTLGYVYALVTLETFDPNNDADIGLRDRIYNQILKDLMDPEVRCVDIDKIIARENGVR